jgi:tRNA modification GTPase
VELSVLAGDGLSVLADAIAAALGTSADHRDRPGITNLRHIALLGNARAALARAHGAVDASGGAIPEEFLLADLMEAAQALQEVTGKRTSDDLLVRIFERFCIGK